MQNPTLVRLPRINFSDDASLRGKVHFDPTGNPSILLVLLRYLLLNGTITM